MRVIWFDSIETTQALVVGGKAAELGRLRQLGYNVPDGFVVTSAAFAEAQVADALVVSPDLGREIESALEILNRRSPQTRGVMVRSSALAEDGEHHSAAGQFATVARAATVDAVVDGIRDVWASAYAERVAHYYERQAIVHQPQMAVIVQKLIEPDVAGVLFTEDIRLPELISIEAMWGLGESVVSGEVIPDRYLVSRETLDIESTTISKHKTRAAVLDESLSVQPLDISDKKDIRTLSAEQIRRLAEIALSIEAHYPAPRDIEWALKDGEFYILQCRAITTQTKDADSVFSTPNVDDSLLWTRAFFEERFPNAMSVLNWSYVFPSVEKTALLEPMRFVGVRDMDRVTRFYRGHVYTRVAVFQKMYKFFPRFLMPDDARRFFPNGNTSLRHQPKSPKFHQFLFSVLKTLLTEPRWHPLNDLVWMRFERRNHHALIRLRAELDDASQPEAIFGVLDQLRTQTEHLLRIHRWSITYAEIFSSLLRRIITRWTRLELEQVQTHLLITSESPSRATDRALAQLANVAAQSGLSPEAVIAGKTSDPFEREFTRFLADYGHRSFSLDIAQPRYADEPEEVRAVIAQMMRVADKDIMRHQLREEVQTALRAELRRSLLDRFFPIRDGFVRIVLHFARRYFALRERQRFEWQRILHLSRRAFLHLEQDLIRAGKLRRPGDIFFLRYEEIQALLRAGAESVPPVDARRRVYQQLKYAPVPRFLNGDEPMNDLTEGLLGPVLHGVDASAGQAVGIARVLTQVDSLNDLLETLCETDILVTFATDPGWTPAFAQIRGLVMSTGGRLSHGAIVAREYGIPAVVAVENAMIAIKTGDKLLVDGDHGVVHILPHDTPG